ncbi:hypothetical protein [Streptomyces sp. SYSU K217416]
MTEGSSPQIHRAPLVVLSVQDDDPPFRLVEIRGELAGKAFSLVDVLLYAHRAGLERLDLDDPASVRWIGGDQFTWGVARRH